MGSGDIISNSASALGTGDTIAADTISNSVSAWFRGHHLIRSVLLGTQSPAFGSFLGARLGSGLLASKNSAEVLFECRQKFLVTQGPARALVSAHQFDVLFPNDLREELATGWCQLEQRGDPSECIVPSANMGSRAAHR
jgi:hypothetical protein